MLYQKLASLSLDASAWIATPGRLVKHDKEAATVSVFCYDCTSLSILSEKIFSFEGEQILAANSGNSDRLAIVSGLKTDVKWTRKQRRRGNTLDDIWAKQEHPLYAHCCVRLFSLSSQLPVGRVLTIQESAVHATVRVRGVHVLVQTTGPKCLATILRSPLYPGAYWGYIHQELTWDPNIIAKERGYADADAEPDPRLPEDENSERMSTQNDSENEEAAYSERFECTDDEILGYEFLSEFHIMRVTESGRDRQDATYGVEVFQPDPVTCTVPLVLGMGKHLFRVEIYHCLPYIGIPKTLTARQKDSALDSGIVHVMIYASDNGEIHEISLRVSALLALVANPMSVHDDREAAQSVLVSSLISKYSGKLSISISPTLYRNIALTPICDIEEVEGLLYPSLHFLDFRDDKNSPTHRRLPLMTLTSTFDFGGLENGVPKLVAHSWDGQGTIIISRSGAKFEPRRAWLVKFDTGLEGSFGFWGPEG